MRIISISAAIGAALAVASAAQAQDASANGTSFRGFRAEAQVGGDRYQSQGTHDDKVSWGGAIGWDGVIADKWVVGPEFSYWRGGAKNQTAGVTGGTVTQKGYRELGAGVRAGYLVSPKLLVYGIGGYVNDKQRQIFSGIGTTGAGGFNRSIHASGYQAGGGAEYSLTQNLYTGIGYRYSDYEGHTARQRVYATAGVRF
jgi:outer membrane immunogenic protein